MHVHAFIMLTVPCHAAMAAVRVLFDTEDTRLSLPLLLPLQGVWFFAQCQSFSNTQCLIFGIEGFHEERIYISLFDNVAHQFQVGPFFNHKRKIIIVATSIHFACLQRQSWGLCVFFSAVWSPAFSTSLSLFTICAIGFFAVLTSLLITCRWFQKEKQIYH